MLQANASLREVFANPTIPLEQKRGLLKRLLEATRPTTTTANFLKVLLQNQRLTELSEINLKLTQVLDERAGLVAATVTTARPVPDSTRSDLKTTLAKLTGKNVRIEGFSVWRVKDGQAVEAWGLVDIAGLMRQLKA